MSTPARPVRVTVLGAGAWGTALAALASRQCDTVLWARDDTVAQSVQAQHVNPRYLSDITLPDSLAATSDFARALEHACDDGTRGLLILGVPMAGLDAMCSRLAQSLTPASCASLSIVWTCKGLQHDTGHMAHQVADAHLGPLSQHGLGLGVLSGPSFAHEVARGLPVALTIATRQSHVADTVTLALHGDTARIYSSPDVIGVEIGGALKNVMAIACGISDGLGLGDNARAALITRGLSEIQRLGLALGGQADTFFGLTGLGDLVLTTTGALSRNRQVGLALGQGQRLDTILATGITAEGVHCVQAAVRLGRQHQVDLPITQAVHDVLFNGLAAPKAVATLLSREARPETSQAPDL